MQTSSLPRKGFRVEPISTYLDRWRAPIVPVVRAGGTVYVSGLPPFDPETGDILPVPIERQTELVLDQMRLCLEAAGTSLRNVLKCNIYCTSVETFTVMYSGSPRSSLISGLRRRPLHPGIVLK